MDRSLWTAEGGEFPVRRLVGIIMLCTVIGGSSLHALAHASNPDPVGVLVMAHGGDPAWNEGVLDIVRPLREHYPLEVAFGMATADSLQAAIRALEERGVRRIAVVRLFLSGASFLERTEQILGLAPGAPDRPEDPTHHEDADHGGHRMEFWRVETRASFVLSEEGLLDSHQIGEILAARARDLSRHAPSESVLILAHGAGDDAENETWLKRMDRLAEGVRKTLPFREVVVETLREDWPDKREVAERRIRGFVERAGQGGGKAIVIPFRVHGFGPYADVLSELDYVSDGRGLLPDSRVAEWIREQAADGFARMGW